MARFKFNSKIKGIFSVSSSNFVALGISMMTSFILPYFISVAEYGYWQLFWLYTSYVGVLALGFNDGIHLNYAKYDYDSLFIGKFKVFRSFVFWVSAIETIILIGCLYIFRKQIPNDIIFNLLIILNVLPTIVLGFFSYMNQGTMRFKQYSIGNIIDKIIFGIIMVLLIIMGCKKAIYYITAFTLSKYFAIIYHCVSSKEVFGRKENKIRDFRQEIKTNFVKGFPLMVATILGGASIIVGGRLLVEDKFGIEAFSSYSFSLHTLVIANQFVAAIATVFYPIMQRVSDKELPNLYRSFDEVTALMSMVLLLSYYLILLLIYFVYSKYIGIAEYLYIVYPLFIYQCKSNLLIMNMYKVRKKTVALIFVNLAGVLLNIVFVYLAYILFRTLFSVALATTVGFMVWYYLCVLTVYKKEKWKVTFIPFFDIIYILMFIFINYLCLRIWGFSIISYSISLLAWIGIILICYFGFTKSIKRILKEFSFLMKD